MFLFPQKLWTQLIGVSFFFFQIHVHIKFPFSSGLTSMSDWIFSPPFFGEKIPIVFPKINAALVFGGRRKRERKLRKVKVPTKWFLWGKTRFFSHTQKKPKVIGGHHRPKKKPSPFADTYPLPSGTFESMMFLLPFGGFWDRFLEGTRTGG